MSHFFLSYSELFYVLKTECSIFLKTTPVWFEDEGKTTFCSKSLILGLEPFITSRQKPSVLFKFAKMSEFILKIKLSLIPPSKDEPKFQVTACTNKKYETIQTRTKPISKQDH